MIELNYPRTIAFKLEGQKLVLKKGMKVILMGDKKEFKRDVEELWTQIQNVITSPPNATTQDVASIRPSSRCRVEGSFNCNTSRIRGITLIQLIDRLKVIG